MDLEKLQHTLFSSRTRLYAVLDGVQVPNLPKRLYDAQVLNYCLFSGELEPDMLYVAPYVVLLTPDSKFADFVMSEGFGKNWGIFAHSRHSIREMRRHFRSLINVYDENANSMVFRFYDPRVLREFLPTCNPGELRTFFGNVDTFFADAGDAKKLVKLSLDGTQLKQTEV